MEGKRVFSVEFKVAAAKRLLAGEGGSKLHAELAVKRSILYRWADTYRKHGEAALARQPGRPKKRPQAPPPRCPDTPEWDTSSDETLVALAAQQAKRIAELERLAGQQAIDIDFLTRAFKRTNELRPTSNGATASTAKSSK